MDIQSVFKKVSNHIAAKKPLVLFSLPNSQTVNGLFQEEDTPFEISTITEEGFLFSPYDTNNKTHFISKSNSESIEFQFPASTVSTNNYTLKHSKKEKNFHEKIVARALEKIQDTKLQKVVITRKKELTFKHFNIEKLIEYLFSSSQTSFRYLWYHPETYFWCGASPETLVKLKGNDFSTVALAGTKNNKNGMNSEWSHKEHYEQQIVTDAIYDSLQNLTPVLKVSKPYDFKYGHLYHIRTDITGVIRNSNAKLSKILKALHPTPAVCGMPKALAKKHIFEQEGYDRSFYTGYLGPIHQEGTTSHVFVNLRCMQFSHTNAVIYAGGGIVPESIPEKEWEETCLKMQPMANVIGAML